MQPVSLLPLLILSVPFLGVPPSPKTLNAGAPWSIISVFFCHSADSDFQSLIPSLTVQFAPLAKGEDAITTLLKDFQCPNHITMVL